MGPDVVEVEGPFVDLGQRRALLLHGARRGEREVAGQVAARVARHEAHGEVDAVVMRPARVEDAVRARLPAQLDATPEARRAPLAVGRDHAGRAAGRAIAGGVAGQTMDAHEVPRVAEARRAAPREVAVVAEAEGRVAREAAALHAVLGTLEVHGVPVGGERHERNVRVVRQHGRARRAPRARHRPVVAARGGQVHGRLGQRALAAPLEARGVLPGRVGMEQARQRVARVPAHGVEGELVLEVHERDREAARARRDEAVGGMPRPHAPEQQVLGRVDAVHRAQRGVDALCERLDAGARPSRHLLEVAMARRLEVERAQEPVEVGHAAAREDLVATRRGAQVAEQLAQAAGPDVPQQIELGEAVGGLEEAQRGVQVSLVLGPHVRDPARVAHDLEPPAHGRQVRGGERRARARLAPSGRGGREAQRHREAALARQGRSRAPAAHGSAAELPEAVDERRRRHGSAPHGHGRAHLRAPCDRRQGVAWAGPGRDRSLRRRPRARPRAPPPPPARPRTGPPPARQPAPVSAPSRGANPGHARTGSGG